MINWFLFATVLLPRLPQGRSNVFLSADIDVVLSNTLQWKELLCILFQCYNLHVGLSFLSSCPSSRIFNVFVRDRNWKTTGNSRKAALLQWFFHCFCSCIFLPRQVTCPLLIAKASPYSHGSVSWAASSLSFRSLTTAWPWAVALTLHGGGRRWHQQGLSPACYSREKSEQGQNAALLSSSLPWSNILLHDSVFTDLFRTGYISNSVGCSILNSVFWHIMMLFWNTYLVSVLNWNLTRCPVDRWEVILNMLIPQALSVVCGRWCCFEEGNTITVLVLGGWVNTGALKLYSEVQHH